MAPAILVGATNGFLYKINAVTGVDTASADTRRYVGGTLA
jgi:hypothetical protein